MGASKAKAAGEEAQEQTGSASTNRGAGSNGTGVVQRVRPGLGVVWWQQMTTTQHDVCTATVACSAH